MNRLMKHISFTRNEIKVIIFVISILITGFAIKYYKYLAADISDNYDYSHSDSEFVAKSRLAYKNNLSVEENSNSDSLKIPVGGIVNLNTAEESELVELPGIGEATAENIISYRIKNNGFRKAEDLMKVKGIGKKKFEKLKNHIKVE